MDRLVTRQQWGARAPRRRTLLDPTDVRHLVLHYTAAQADEQEDHRRCAARVRAVQAFHMDTRGWDDIAYNWLVCRHGYIYRGRGWPVRSAATGNANAYTVAACFLGADAAGRDDVTAAGRNAFREVYRFVEAHAPHLGQTFGHSHFMATSCPGDELRHLATLLP